MALIIEGGLDLPIPRMIPVRQKFSEAQIADIRGEIAGLFRHDGKMKRIRAQSRIAVAVGSRGIHAIDRITLAVVEELKRLGASPFIIPSMGSHGGATAEGQRKVLAGFGITEETMGVPVVSSMETVQVGELDDGTPVFLDKEALGSDGIVVINRIKPHTAFVGDYESGLLKMVAIGLGKHRGATVFHSCGMDRFGELLPQLGRVVLAKAPILFGLAVIENAYDRPARFEIVWNEDMIGREKSLLAEARALMPRVIPGNLDVIIVHEIGKEISGAGLDPNITGRSGSLYFKRENSLKVQRIVVLNLSKATKGNATGIGLADVTTDRAVKAMNPETTWINCITSGVMASAKLPIHMPTDREAIVLALKTCARVNHPQSRIVWIRNTLALERIWVSEPLLAEMKRHPADRDRRRPGAYALRRAGQSSFLAGGRTPNHNKKIPLHSLFEKERTRGGFPFFVLSLVLSLAACGSFLIP